MTSKWYLALILLIALLLAIPCRADGPSCDLTIQGCIKLVQAEDTQIMHLKSDVKDLEKKLTEETSPLVPWWGWMALGVVAGGSSVYFLRK